jgi:hypothetical protein
MRMKKPRKAGRLDAAKLLAEIQAEKRSAALDIEVAAQVAARRNRRLDSFQLIQAVVAGFTFKSGRAHLLSRPDDTLIALLAERFRVYLNGSKSLDEAFHLKKPSPGRGNPRERERLRVGRFAARMIYDGLRNDGMLKKQAIPEVARLLKCTETKAHSLIFKSPSATPVAQRKKGGN